MSDQNERLRPQKKPQLTEADKALLEAEPDWERMGQAAKRLLSASDDRPIVMRRHKRNDTGAKGP